MKSQNQLNSSIESVKKLLTAILRLPLLWLITIGLVILLSTVRIEYISPKNYLDSETLKISFQITYITLLLIVAVWLPSIIKILALLGGGIKFSNTEMSTSGLFKSLADLVVAFDSVEPELNEDKRNEIKIIRDEAERELASNMTQDKKEARANMLELSKEYEVIRRNMSPSKERTTIQGNIFARMRALSTITNYSINEIQEFLKSDSIGPRILGLAVLQVQLHIHCFDQVIKIIELSTVPYEQYQAIRVLETMLEHLNKEQYHEVIRVLEYQQSGASGTILSDQDKGRWNRSLKILEFAKNRLK